MFSNISMEFYKIKLNIKISEVRYIKSDIDLKMMVLLVWGFYYSNDILMKDIQSDQI